MLTRRVKRFHQQMKPMKKINIVAGKVIVTGKTRKLKIRFPMIDRFFSRRVPRDSFSKAA